MKPNDKSLLEFFWVPGLPHLLSPKLNPNYAKLAEAANQVGARIRDTGCERILYYSTGWLSVLGTSFQAQAQMRGTHVDENWYELGDLPFDLKVDRAFAESMAMAAKEAGFATALVDYEGFPVDTGTIVANQMINSQSLPVGMVSSHVYLDHAGTQKLGSVVAESIRKSGKRTAVVSVSSLSSRYFTNVIDYSKDQIRDAEDDRWNRRMLELMESGDWRAVDLATAEFAQKAKADMSFKAAAFLSGAMAHTGVQWRGKVKAYGPIYGTGAAVLEFNT